MTTLNAFGFFLLGIVMCFAPAFFPEYFAVKALDGSSTSALWLAVMGLLESTMGVTCIIRNEAVPFTVKLLAFCWPTFKSFEPTVPSFVLRPLPDGYLSLEDNEVFHHDQRLVA